VGPEEFQAQVPKWVAMDPDGVVMASGGVEIMLGAGVALLNRDRVLVGRLVRLLFQPVLMAWALWSTAAVKPRR
jgi:uncharacterized membrane protein